MPSCFVKAWRRDAWLEGGPDRNFLFFIFSPIWSNLVKFTQIWSN
jgi:hypothetical protein